jgi:hypothetical protein
MSASSASRSVTVRGAGVLAGGVAAAAILVFVVIRDQAAGGTGTLTVSVVGLGLAAIVLCAIGVNMLRTGRRLAAGEAVATASYRHTFRLFGTFGAAIGLAMVARAMAVPATFGQFGHYRGDAVAAAMVGKPRHLGKAGCAECHETQAEMHLKDAHANVQCENCHGPGAEHSENDGKGGVVVDKTKDGCLMCHRKLTARPGTFAQVDWREHYKFVGVADTSIACVSCHDAHEPLFMDRDLREARLHPMIHRCRNCHVNKIDETAKRSEDHPPIFECSYCHEKTVKDFESRKHHKVACNTCHIFFPQTEYAGRIIRDADPRFCLLCHKRTAFRSKDAPAPSIDWPGHLEKIKAPPEDMKKRCIDCHRDRIHAEKGDR